MQSIKSECVSQRSVLINSPILLILSVMLLSSCSAKKMEADPRLEPPLVPVMLVKTGTGAASSYTGTVKARIESSLGFRVSGKIIERLVDSGQSVKRGQALFRMDRTDFMHNVTARNEAVLSQDSSIESKEHAVEAAKAHLVQAEADEKRYKNALSVGVVTEIAYDQYKAAADSARAEYTAAQAEVESGRKLAASLKAQEKVAADESQYATLISDTDGVVTEILSEPGQVVAAGQPVVKVAQGGPREASIELPENVRPQLGSYASAKLYDGSVPPCRARLRELSQSANKDSRTFEARYVLEGAAAKSPLGATVIVALSGAAAPQRVKVPLTALVDKGDGPSVWVVNSQSETVRLQPVQIDVLGQEDALLSSGLRTGEMLVTQGAHLLHKDEKIRTQISNGAFRPVALLTPPHESK